MHDLLRRNHLPLIVASKPLLAENLRGERTWETNCSVYFCMVPRNSYCPPAGHRCMTHRHALRASAVKIIHTWLASLVLSSGCFVCVDMFRCTVEQRVFVYERCEMMLR
jgi:hypothetical protein